MSLSPVDAHHQGEAERQAAEGRQHPGRPAFCRQRVDDQAQPAEEQDLRQRLAVGRPAGELLGQGEREDEGGQRRPPRPGEPGGQAAEGEHRAGPEQRRHAGRHAHPAGPEPGRHDHRQARHELRHHAPADLVEGEAVEVEQLVGAAERRPRLRNRQRPVVGDPVRELHVGRRVAPHDDLLGVIDQLVGAECGRHRDHPGNRPPGRARLLRPLRQGALPPAGDPAQAEIDEQHRHRHRHHQHQHRREPAGEQQRQPGEQPGHRQQRRQHRQPPQQPPGRARRRASPLPGRTRRTSPARRTRRPRSARRTSPGRRTSPARRDGRLLTAHDGRQAARVGFRVGAHLMASLAGASLASGGVSSAPGHR